MRALIVIDIQNDFCPGGMMEVPEGGQVVPVANEAIKQFSLVAATQEWRPANHSSFAANHLWRRPGDRIQLGGVEQVLLPIHCVQGSFGAEFVQELNTSSFRQVFTKGTAPEIDSYSGFYDKGRRKSTGLGEYLKEQGVKEVYLLGLPLDYSVKHSVLDAIELGFKTYLVIDGCRGRNLEEGDSERAVAEMREKGAIIVTASEL